MSQPSRYLNLPYYGGAKGQILQITKDASGQTIGQRIIPANDNDLQQQDGEQKLTGLQNLQSQQFTDNLRSIQASAQKLVDLQKKSTKSGQFKKEDQRVYATHLALLGEAATKIAKLSNEGNYDLSQLFITKENNDIDNGHKKTTDKQGFNDDEDVGEETDGNTGVLDDADTIEINTPSDSASVAESKPFAFSFAQMGGVASTKPKGYAYTGKDGLSISAPIGISVAGIDLDKIGKLPLGRNTPEVSATAASQQVAQYYTTPQFLLSPQYSNVYPIELAIQ